MKAILVYVVRNHNGTVICKEKDYKNAIEEAMDYESYTGNQTTINEEIMYVEVKR